MIFYGEGLDVALCIFFTCCCKSIMLLLKSIESFKDFASAGIFLISKFADEISILKSLMVSIWQQ